MDRSREIFRENTKFKMLLISVLITGLSYGLYKGMIDNFLAEVVGMGEMDRSVTEFFRELPGIVLIFILADFFANLPHRCSSFPQNGDCHHGRQPCRTANINIGIARKTFVVFLPFFIGSGQRCTTGCLLSAHWQRTERSECVQASAPSGYC